MDDFTTYLALFASAFLAATIIPAQSEAVLTAMLVAGEQPWQTLLIAASIGNVLGSCVNWVLGRWVNHFSGRKWFPVSQPSLDKAERWYRKYGRWSLLLSWVPIIGDPLTVAAGVLREPFAVFLAIVTIAKVGRYLAIAAALGLFAT
jgi:membrane protein YqaA with SNARE-associated domain